MVIETSPVEEAQVDYGAGPMVRDPQTGKYRRTGTASFSVTAHFHLVAYLLAPHDVSHDA